jgi:hypothetical protein
VKLWTKANIKRNRWIIGQKCLQDAR